MSQQLAPRPPEGPPSPGLSSTSSVARTRKISSACLACKQRKTKCSGSSPCEACAQRGTGCLYDASSDQRRKIASQRTLENLTETRDSLERHQQLLGGILAIIRTSSQEEVRELLRLIRTRVNMSQLAAHVRNSMRMSPLSQEEYATIDFIIEIDRPTGDLPSPTQILEDSSAHSINHQDPTAPELSSEATEAKRRIFSWDQGHNPR